MLLALTFTVLGACGKGGEKSKTVSAPLREPVEISSNVDKAVSTTGDIINYTITLSRDPGIPAGIPEVGPRIMGFRIVDMGYNPEKRVEGRMVSNRWYKLRADLVGSYILPDMEIDYQTAEGQKKSKASPVYVEVASVLGKEGEAKDIREIKPIIPYPGRPLWFWAAIIGGPILFLALAWVIWQRRKRKEKTVPERPAWELAQEELLRLKELKLIESGEVKSFFFHLSEIFRRYLERRFGFPALEATQEEIRGYMSNLEWIDNGLKTSAEEFLTGSDMVKYAKHIPPVEEIESRLGQVEAFIEKTIPAPEGESNIKIQENEKHKGS
ncbi:MAG: hypothetical protein NT056_06730 [Proteobacteria bacterium]|nr:hypothetical protein [Pseudomonadota bacterium]